MQNFSYTPPGERNETACACRRCGANLPPLSVVVHRGGRVDFVQRAGWILPDGAVRCPECLRKKLCYAVDLDEREIRKFPSLLEKIMTHRNLHCTEKGAASAVLQYLPHPDAQAIAQEARKARAAEAAVSGGSVRAVHSAVVAHCVARIVAALDGEKEVI